MRRVFMGGLEVPVQGLGCMRITEDVTSADERAAADVVHRALDLGATFLDTADMYGRGRNEEFVGRAVRHRREEAIVCTKFGVVFGAGDDWRIRGDPEYARAACDASLRRLGTDVIDLYYLHRPDPAVPVEETVGAMSALVAAGKVRHIGLSEVTGEELRAAHAVHPVTAVQSQWSLSARGIEAMIPVCAALGVGVVPFSPHGRGLLASVPPAGQPPAHGSSPPGAPAPSLAGALRDVARRHGVRPGQIALSWVQHRAAVWGVPVTPIPGTSDLRHLEENIAAAGIELSGPELARLDSASAGAR